MSGSRKPRPEYSRMFSALIFGGWIFISGLIGYDIRGMRGFFRGGRWVDPPVWGQLAVGAALVALGIYFSRHLPHSTWIRERVAPRITRHIGRGRSAGASRPASLPEGHAPEPKA